MRYIILISILFTQSFVVFSQMTSSSVHGIVTDPTGAVVPNAKVTAILLTEEKSIETNTNDYGEFNIKNLSSGKYKLTVSAIGFGSETERLISVPQDKQLEVNVKIELGLGCDKIAEDSGIVTDEDKMQILTLAVANALNPNSHLLESEQKNDGIIVSTGNIKSEWLKNLTFPKMKFMSRTQIQQKADREGDFLFVSFPYLKVKGQCVALEVSNTWAIGKNSKTVYLSGGGYRYEFRKVNGKWIMKELVGWVS